MVKRLLVGLFFALALFAAPAQAQQVIIVSACGTVPASVMALTAGLQGALFIDTLGNLCGSAPAAGTNAIGYVGGFDVAVSVVPTIQAAAYASGNAAGALQTVVVFRSTTQPSGIIDNFLLAWKGTETTALTFYVFDTNPTGSTCTDKTAFVLAAADIPKLALQPFTLTAAAPSVGTTATFANSSFSPTSVKNQDGTPSLNLYVCAVSGGTFTPAVGDLTYKISVAQD